MNCIALKQSQIIHSAALLLCLAGGCVRSIQPVLKDEQLITDDRVLGSWVSKDGKTSGEVTASDDHKGYKLLYTDEDGKKANLQIRLGKIGDMTIAESSIDDPVPGASGVYKMHLLPLHSFMVVKETAPRIVLKMMDPGWLYKYLDAHPTELATIRHNKDDILISAKTEDIQGFLLQHITDDGALGEDGIYVRPGDPTTRPTTMPVGNPPP